MSKMDFETKLSLEEYQLENDVKIIPHQDYYELRVRGIKLRLTPKQFDLITGEKNTN
ncbi:hypothetical protein [Scopulibacillus cellulosilyticus]|uniref:Uncharacterized protein n=1 Tax=Scopulibacillus cellulosilyticus TaxID=2665665 RepID=A0ABW2PVH8_9BACL